MRHTAEEIAFLTDLLDRLGEERDAMTVVELDGYVAGLVLCPEWIGPAEWLPLVWGGARASEDVEESVDATIAVAAHYRRVAEDLASEPQGYRAVLGFYPGSGELLWEPWVWGFRRAKGLRSEAWLQVGAVRAGRYAPTISSCSGITRTVRGMSGARPFPAACGSAGLLPIVCRMVRSSVAARSVETPSRSRPSTMAVGSSGRST